MILRRTPGASLCPIAHGVLAREKRAGFANAPVDRETKSQYDKGRTGKTGESIGLSTLPIVESVSSGGRVDSRTWPWFCESPAEVTRRPGTFSVQSCTEFFRQLFPFFAIVDHERVVFADALTTGHAGLL